MIAPFQASLLRLQLQPILLESGDELPRMRQSGEVAPIHLVGSDTQPLLHHSAHELGREEAIVAAQQKTGRPGRL